MKKTISSILCILLIFSSVSNCLAADKKAELYDIFQDGMLFRQNSVSSVAGTAKPGAEISITFSDGSDTINAIGFADQNGCFAVDFAAPRGGFSEYTLTVEENGKVFAERKNIVFGELWLCSGQSNMQYNLGGIIPFDDVLPSEKERPENLHILYVEPVSYYKGTTELTPAEKQENTEKCLWFTADKDSALACSAVGYYFGDELLSRLDVPVGIISCSLGGSKIVTWLSREDIDNDEYVKNQLIAKNEYFPTEGWNESERSQYYDMTCNFNTKIYPLRHLNVSGFIWYQGESDVMLKNSAEYYGRMFDLLQKGFTENFRYEGGKMPVVFTQLAGYWYGESVGLFNEYNLYYEKMQQSSPEDRALITIYDIPLDYNDAGSIHPGIKEPVGRRMGAAADGMCYHQSDLYTAATVKSTDTRDGKLYVTFRNTGDGLICPDGRLDGFSVCGEDGIYVNAKADIVSDDTIAVYSDYVAEPVSASYAYVLDNTLCDLYSSANGNPSMPVGCFITDCDYTENQFFGMYPINALSEKIWHIHENEIGYYNVFECDNAALTFKDGTINVKENPVSNNRVILNTVFREKDNLFADCLTDMNRDYRNYGKIYLDVINSGCKDITFTGINFRQKGLIYKAPSYSVIPADGQTHTVEADLNSLQLNGNRGGILYSNEILKDITELKYCFITSSGEQADFTVNGIYASPDLSGKNGISFPNEISDDGIFQFISSLFNVIIGKIVRLFEHVC